MAKKTIRRSPDNASSQVRRDSGGRIVKGSPSPNPGGRPKGFGAFRATCQDHSEKAVEALLAALEDPRNRVKAAEVILAYAWGKPAQAIQLGGLADPIKTESTIRCEPPSREHIAGVIEALARTGKPVAELLLGRTAAAATKT